MPGHHKVKNCRLCVALVLVKHTQLIALNLPAHAAVTARWWGQVQKEPCHYTVSAMQLKKIRVRRVYTVSAAAPNDGAAKKKESRVHI